jgi:hypothetical protein
MQERLDSLRLCLGGDGVHLTEQGRFHLFNNLAKTIMGLKDGCIGKPPKTAEAAAASSLTQELLVRFRIRSRFHQQASEWTWRWAWLW